MEKLQKLTSREIGHLFGSFQILPLFEVFPDLAVTPVGGNTQVFSWDPFLREYKKKTELKREFKGILRVPGSEKYAGICSNPREEGKMGERMKPNTLFLLSRKYEELSSLELRDKDKTSRPFESFQTLNERLCVSTTDNYHYILSVDGDKLKRERKVDGQELTKFLALDGLKGDLVADLIGVEESSAHDEWETYIVALITDDFGFKTGALGFLCVFFILGPQVVLVTKSYDSLVVSVCPGSVSSPMLGKGSFPKEVKEKCQAIQEIGKTYFDEPRSVGKFREKFLLFERGQCIEVWVWKEGKFVPHQVLPEASEYIYVLSRELVALIGESRLSLWKFEEEGRTRGVFRKIQTLELATSVPVVALGYQDTSPFMGTLDIPIPDAIKEVLVDFCRV